MLRDDSKKKTCDTCGGSGQISYFKGVSRFLLSIEDCPACFGLGYMMEDEGDDKLEDPCKLPKRPSSRKNKS